MNPFGWLVIVVFVLIWILNSFLRSGEEQKNANRRRNAGGRPEGSSRRKTEIEEFLEEQDGVSEAAVAAAPDRVRGEVPVAYIVTTRPLDPADLEACCREKLASFKIPRSFIVVEKLPRNALGKVQKHLLPKNEDVRSR